ncbi:hypothetical protein DNTS_018594 [Danionella cerebrum]|uniref:Uncharacterized protein n=1 Tax=Danionella cerebrum TaxID=2873325 RepID=A0A553Q9K9_9TELE|nr:hypothetical protein DNTS_018594 [Danionella translucida]
MQHSGTELLDKMKVVQESWSRGCGDICPLDLGLFQTLERERVLEVLQRDRALRAIDTERVRRLRADLHGFSVQNSPGGPFGQRACARCQRVLGQLWDCGSVCSGCSQRICTRCRVVRSPCDWRCTLCQAYRNFKIKSGEWFMEQQAKKFSDPREINETTGDKLLESYHRLSFIEVVPPTPPFYEAPLLEKEKEHKRPFTRSMENLLVSVGAHIRKISKSQNDLSEEIRQLTVEPGIVRFSRQKSHSEGAIYAALCKLPSLSQNSRDEEQHSSMSQVHQTEEEEEEDDDVSCTSAGTDQRVLVLVDCKDTVTLHKEGAVYYKRNHRVVMKDCSSSTGPEEVIPEKRGTTGEILTGIAYNPSSSCLQITILTCRKLMLPDSRTSARLSVKLCLLPKKSHKFNMKTAVKRAESPVFNETFTCVLPLEQLKLSVLQLSVWLSRGFRRKRCLGETFIHLAELHLNESRRSLCCKLNPQTHPPEGGLSLSELELKEQVRLWSWNEI